MKVQRAHTTSGHGFIRDNNGSMGKRERSHDETESQTSRVTQDLPGLLLRSLSLVTQSLCIKYFLKTAPSLGVTTMGTNL